MHKNVSYFIAQRRYFVNTMLSYNKRNACGTIRWEQLNHLATLQFSCQNVQTYNKLVTLHFEYVSHPVFLTTSMQRIPSDVESV
jgi:hypothetical protein